MRPVEQFRAAALVCALIGLTGACRPTAGSIALRFPNEEARAAMVRLEVEIYDADAGLARFGDRSCGEFLGAAAEGRTPSGVPELQRFLACPDGEAQCPEGWFTQEPPFDIPSGRTLIYVLGYASTDPGATPFLEGCTDRFDTGGSGDGSESVPVDLALVVPASVRLVLASPSNVVGAVGGTPDTALAVRVEAESPGPGQQTYGIPGVPIRFEVEGEAQIVGAGPYEATDVATGPDGQAEIRITLPPEPGTSFVTARSEAVAAAERTPGRRSEVRFVASSVAPAPFRSATARITGSGVPVAAAAGVFEPGARPSVAILGCDGEPEACDPAVARAPLGEARLSVLTDLDGTPRPLDVEPWGPAVLPTDIVFVPYLDARPRLAGLFARRADCQDRVCTDPASCPCWTQQSGTPCPCEGSELRLFDRVGSTVTSAGRLTLTASNAVALTAYVHPPDREPRLAVAGQGRQRNDRPCATADECLPADLPQCRTEPEGCGCPPEERCLCPGCPVTGPTGVCVPSDRMIDVVGAEGRAAGLENLQSCQVRAVRCNNDPDDIEFECRCGEGTPCSARDGCRCPIPPRIWVGDRENNVAPLDLAGGRFGSPTGEDLAVAADSGLIFIERAGATLESSDTTPLTNTPVDGVTTARLDPLADRAAGGDELDDVAFYAASPCLEGLNFQAACPIVRSVEEPRGCFGVYLSAGATSFFDFDAICRRFELEEQPRDICTGDFDGNQQDDVAVTTVDGDAVLLFLGDGWGGVSFPPQEVALPPGTGSGPIACADLDGDGITDIVVADREGNVSIARSGP